MHERIRRGLGAGLLLAVAWLLGIAPDLTAQQTPLPPPNAALVVVDAPSNNAIVNEGFAVVGWALDPRAGAEAGPGVTRVSVHRGESCDGERLGQTAPDIPRPDVTALYGLDDSYTLSGFSIPIAVQVDTRITITVCADSTQAETPHQGPTLVVNFDASRLYIDTPAPDAWVAEALSITGWALDSRVAAGQGPGVEWVRVFAGEACEGDPLAEVAPRRSRPDVVQLFGLDDSFLLSGFALTINDLNSQRLTFTVCIYADAQSQAALASETRRVTFITPRLTLDAPSADTANQAPITIRGWALDLTAPPDQGNGISYVRLYQAEQCAGTLLAEIPTDRRREDVLALYDLPPRYADSGFALTVDEWRSGTFTFTACAYSLQARGPIIAETRTFSIAEDDNAPWVVIGVGLLLGALALVVLPRLFRWGDRRLGFSERDSPPPS